MSVIELTDVVARSQAVNPELSCIVRAPAGSGKTELLIQRLLALLGRVERPDEILAITFTRKAAAEMGQRVLVALRQAQESAQVGSGDHARLTRQLACAVLKRDHERGWHLLQHPDQLQIQTIDSFNAALVRRMPWLSRLGGLPQVSEQPTQLYRAAVRQVVHLHHCDSEHINKAVRQLLIHLDNRADILEDMLINLLGRRDQWLRHLLTDEGRQRQELEGALSHIVADYLRQLLATVDPVLQQELLVLGAFAADNCAKPDKALCALDGIAAFPQPVPADLYLWCGFADLLLTADGGWRKRCDKNMGFPAGKKEPGATMKQRMTQLLASLREQGHSPALWGAVRSLPDPQYSEQQWYILQALVTLLPQAVAQLWLEFSRSGEVDFSEIALKARQALVDSGNPTEQLLMLDHRVQHILIDEFQDTSWLQFDLLKTVTAGWQAGDGRSLFIVGDPMQSIYRFREAEVGLFLQAGMSGVAGFPLQPLQLQANFRSQQGVVAWVNRWFPTIFPELEDVGSGAVCYAHAQSVLPQEAGEAVQVFAQHQLNIEDEAATVCTLVAQLLCQPNEQTIAILVRSRPHLTAILRALRAAGIRYQAQNVDPLVNRPAVSDLVALTRAILHSADHLSWMTVLRAPWCGLCLADLDCFRREHDTTMVEMLTDPERLQRLSANGQLRVGVVGSVLTAAIARRGRCSLRELIEDTWQALEGSECYSMAACRDVDQSLCLLEKLDHGGDLLSFEQLDEELRVLFSAADERADGQVQVMTIHKAKGLEFDHVILPGLGRRPRGADKSLIRWQEHPEYGLLLAPIAARGDADDDPIYELLGQVEQKKSAHEVARLLYVAITRAKRHVYLFGHAELNKDDEPRPTKGSLLEKLWPAVEAQFIALVDDADDVVEPGADRASGLPLQRLSHVRMVELGAIRDQADVDNSACQEVPLDAQIPLADDRIAALVGTLTHSWLEYLALNGGGCWSPDRIELLREPMATQLRMVGVDSNQAQEHGERIVRMLNQTITSKRGRWILHAHEQARCEYPLSGVVDGELVNLVIDRTFVVDGERWIIDYKTSAALSGQNKADFYAQQSERYRAQLERYRLFLSQIDPEHPCRCALYFPAFDGWCELEDSCFK
ncbi:MAG: UvrD-helicase domain-containing protein [Thermodesulfobacteriota bacterium]|nr:UvrD-helicase domain-containing protein [Thermodesulfobacteriota bacterium]